MVAFLISTISIGVVFLYGCVGEILTEKSGNLNLGIPGIMSVGAAGGCLGVSLYMGGLSDTADANYFLVILSAVLMSALFSAALGAVYSFLTVSLRCNQNVTGLTVTTFGVGLTTFMMESVVDRSRLSAASTLIKLNLPFAESLGVVGEVFFSHGIFVYLAIVIAIVCGWILNRTRIGLNLRAVGENPAAADAAGINVTRYKYVPTCVGSVIAGLGGMFYIMDRSGGMWGYGVEAIGWLAVALVIFALWRPIVSILGSFVFGAFYIAPNYIGGANRELFALLPYVVTVLVLILTSVLNSRETQPPAALGLAYFREER